MAWSDVQRPVKSVWELAARQHGAVSRGQLIALGLSAAAIDHRLAIGRLHRIHPAVYAVGRPELSRKGRWMAAVLVCGEGAMLSHESAAALWEIRSAERAIEISVPVGKRPRPPRSIILHRRTNLSAEDLSHYNGIPVTGLTLTLVDLAARLPADEVEAAVNEADKLDLIRPEKLRAMLDEALRRPGRGALKRILDRHTLHLTDSELERRFLRLVHKSGQPMPLTQARVNGFRVDFYWPELNLVAETDGLRYHRTAAAQAADARRDQAHAVAGTQRLRFSHAQIVYEPGYVLAVLRAVAGSPRAGGTAQAVGP